MVPPCSGAAYFLFLFYLSSSFFWLYRAAQEADKDALVDWSRLVPGTAAAGSVHDTQDYGIVCDLEAHPDLVGLLNTQQV